MVRASARALRVYEMERVFLEALSYLIKVYGFYFGSYEMP